MGRGTKHGGCLDGSFFDGVARRACILLVDTDNFSARQPTCGPGQCRQIPTVQLPDGDARSQQLPEHDAVVNTVQSADATAAAFKHRWLLTTAAANICLDRQLGRRGSESLGIVLGSHAKLLVQHARNGQHEHRHVKHVHESATSVDGTIIVIVLPGATTR